MNDKWLTPKDLAKEFGMSIPYQAILRKNKKIPFSKIGRKIFYNIDKLNKWLEEHQVS